MLEVIYRIYQVADAETAKTNLEKDLDFGLLSSTSKAQNIEILMDCIVCDSRDHFKSIIRDQYGEKITFRYSKNLQPGDLYCVIIGEHCYNTERYFNRITFTCDCCGSTVETYYGKPIYLADYEIRQRLYNIATYSDKRFCSNRCKQVYLDQEHRKIKPPEDEEFYICKDMFTENISGYIYKITKKSTGEFYIGQTMYAPVFRWGQHLKTARFPISDITDYQFEVIEIVPKSVNILDREKYYIQKYYIENPDKSLNIACTVNINLDRGGLDET